MINAKIRMRNRKASIQSCRDSECSEWSNDFMHWRCTRRCQTESAKRSQRKSEWKSIRRKIAQIRMHSALQHSKQSPRSETASNAALRSACGTLESLKLRTSKTGIRDLCSNMIRFININVYCTALREIWEMTAANCRENCGTNLAQPVDCALAAS